MNSPAPVPLLRVPSEAKSLYPKTGTLRLPVNSKDVMMRTWSIQNSVPKSMLTHPHRLGSPKK